MNEKPSLPIFWCKLTLHDSCCEFNNVLLNDSFLNFQPASENVSAVKKITFNSSIIPILSNDPCRTFPYLLEFHLRKSKLRTISKESFDLCINMKSLYLIGNELSELNDGIFDFNTNLERLYLNINYIKHLHSKVFINLKQLKTLHLQDNKLVKFDACQVLSSQTNLEQLVIHTNDLLELDEDGLVRCLPELKKIGFNNNLFACERVEPIMRRFEEKRIKVHKDFSFRKRFHSQEELYNDILCLDEITWMAVHYRKMFLSE